MTTFDDRERAYENLFAHDEEMRFRAVSRRNKGVAAWAATRMGREGESLAGYQSDIVALGLAASDASLADRIAADLSAAGVPTTTADVEAEMRRRLAEAVAAETTA